MVDLETLSLPPPTYASDRAARPPTPPRESNVEEPRSGALKRVFGLFRRTSSISTTTTPQSSAESLGASSGSVRKKVEWREDLEDCIVPTSIVKGIDIFSTPPVERKPPKSILKANQHHVPEDASGYLSGNKRSIPLATTSAVMLESTIQQLAGTDRSAKADAYLTLSELLKTSENLPDVRALRNKMEELLSFIKRDLTEKADDGKAASSLAVNALVLLCSFFYSTTIAELLPSEFAIFIVEQSIKTLEDPQAPKDVARHLMFIMAKQNFSSKTMSQERVGRLVKALHNIESGNLTGKRIIDGRINIYRTLIRQSRSHLLSNHLWIQDLFTDMTSKLKETRSHAITFGLEAAFSLGMEVKVTRAVSILFETEVQEKGKYGHIFINRLKQMLLQDNEKVFSSAAAVPQIWSVVVLFFQGRVRLLQQWGFLADWLKIISDSFNQSDISARKEALLAWNRFIFVVYSSDQSLVASTASNLKKLLPQALERQLRRENLRAPSLASLCCLLHYSFKTATTAAQIDTCWNDYVVRLVGNSLIPADVTRNPKKAKLALADSCSVLQWLFDHATPRTYNENRILENKFPVNELLPLDPKWLRKSALIVFPLLSSLLEKLYWELGEESDIRVLWATYLKSISSPALKEIKVANDTMTSLACIFGFLYKIWHKGPKALHSIPRQSDRLSESAAFVESFDHLTTTLLSDLGHLPFMERQLTIGTSETFVPVATPSQRPGKLRGQVKTPLHHLVTLLATPAPNLEYDQAFGRLVQRILTPFFECQKNKSSHIELSKSLLEILPIEKTEPCKIIWQVVAKFATSAVDFRETQKTGPHDQPLGAGYKDLIKILEFGIEIAQNEPLAGWTALLDATACSAVLDAGDSGKAISIVEPLAASLIRSNLPISPLTRLLHFNLLVAKAAYPKDRQALDVAGKKLWGASTSYQKGTSFDPFVRLYDLCEVSLETSYILFDKKRLHSYIDMVAATTALLTRCPSALYFGVLPNIQIGISLWAQNTNDNFSSGDSLSTAVMSLLKKSYDIIFELQKSHNHSALLSKFETLLCAGLESKQQKAINVTIEFWNSSFGLSKQELHYPDRLKAVLLGLRAITEIELPSLPASLVPEEPVDQRQLMDFEDSQFNPGSVLSASSSSSVLKVHQGSHLGPSPIRRGLNATPQVLLRSLKRSQEETPDSKEAKIRKREITPRLRHDDSQVHFQPIDSSPIIDRVLDSQRLTDRQKEVKNRQQADARMFQSIGSSPLRRSRSVEEADPELPVHQSSSLLHSASRARFPTPTLVTPSDDDGFVASSPTPTRSLKEGVDKNPSTSSPSQRTREPVVLDFDEIPSSPPEQQDDPYIDFTGSILPSAQIEASSLHQDAVIFTHGIITDTNEILSTVEDITADEIRAQLDVEAGIEDRDEAPIEAHTHIPGSSPSRVELVVEGVGETSEPANCRNESLFLSPKPPHEAFVDARDSPASSDKMDGEEDVFEDAVSSPRLHIERLPVMAISSSLSDLDESSIIRALAEADGQGRQTTTILAVDEENRHVHRQKPSASLVEETNFSKSSYLPGGESVLRAGEVEHHTYGTRSKTRVSTLPLYIPAVSPPGALPVSEIAKLPYSHVRMEHQEFGTDSKKRKLDITEDQDEIPDQEVNTKVPSRPSQAFAKSGSRRPRKYPRPSQEFDTGIEFGGSWSPLSVASMVEEESKPLSQNLPAFLDKALMEVSANDHYTLNEDVVHGRGDQAENGFEILCDMTMMGLPAQSQTSPDVIEEATVERSNWSSPNKLVVNSTNGADSIDETSREVIAVPANVAGSGLEARSSEIEGASMQIIEETRFTSQESTGKTNTMDFARAQVQALMGMLKDAALTRGEVTEIEDLLMDTKELLYGAARRGRNL